MPTRALAAAAAACAVWERGAELLAIVELVFNLVWRYTGAGLRRRLCAGVMLPPNPQCPPF
jgi:hypothetical protein